MEMGKNKILFLVTEDWYFLSHRLKMAKYFSNKGYEIHVCCKDTGRSKDFISYDFIHHNIKMQRKSSMKQVQML